MLVSVVTTKSNEIVGLLADDRNLQELSKEKACAFGRRVSEIEGVSL